MTQEGLTLYFVRHAETYLNRYNRMQGWSNAPLTDEGIVDARRSGRGLRDVKFDAVYTSDLPRTSDTAEIILAENHRTDPEKEIILMPEFREVFFGAYEGEYGDVYFKKIAEHLGYDSTEKMFRNSSEFEQMAAAKEIDPHKHAEDFMDFWLRAQEGLLQVVSEHRDKGETILIVAHGITIRILLENLIPDLKDTNPLQNASVSVTHYENGRFHLDRYGDVSHFAAID